MKSKYDIAVMQGKSRPWRGIASLFIVLALALYSVVGSAQQLTGSLSGTAYDQTGAVIPNATIVLKNEASGDLRKTKADGAGYFTITAVPPATYTLTISATGFYHLAVEGGIVMNQGDSRADPEYQAERSAVNRWLWKSFPARTRLCPSIRRRSAQR